MIIVMILMTVVVIITEVLPPAPARSLVVLSNRVVEAIGWLTCFARIKFGNAQPLAAQARMKKNAIIA